MWPGRIPEKPFETLVVYFLHDPRSLGIPSEGDEIFLAYVIQRHI